MIEQQSAKTQFFLNSGVNATTAVTQAIHPVVLSISSTSSPSSSTASAKVNNTLLNALISNTAKSNAAAILVPTPVSVGHKQGLSVLASSSTIPTEQFLNQIASRLSSSKNKTETVSATSNYVDGSELVDDDTTRVYRKIKPTTTDDSTTTATTATTKSPSSTSSNATTADTSTQQSQTNFQVSPENKASSIAEETRDEVRNEENISAQLLSETQNTSINNNTSTNLTLPSFPSTSSIQMITAMHQKDGAVVANSIPTSNNSQSNPGSANMGVSSAATSSSSSSKNVPGVGELPPNWEARVDQHGRVFYIGKIPKTRVLQYIRLQLKY